MTRTLSIFESIAADLLRALWHQWLLYEARSAVRRAERELADLWLTEQHLPAERRAWLGARSAARDEVRRLERSGW